MTPSHGEPGSGFENRVDWIIQMLKGHHRQRRLVCLQIRKVVTVHIVKCALNGNCHPGEGTAGIHFHTGCHITLLGIAFEEGQVKGT